MKRTVGLTGLTMNAMALIAPGAFLWLTFFIQATTGVTAPAMWIGIVIALLLCLATAVCYAEMAKLYPGTGSSYYFAEQSFLNHDKAWRYARVCEIHRRMGLASLLLDLPWRDGRGDGHLVRLSGRNAVAKLHECFEPGSGIHDGWSPIVFSFLVAYIAHRGITGATSVNIAINVIQISALLVFSFIALSYRVSHKPGSEAYQFDSTSDDAYNYEFAMTSQMVNGEATDVVVRDSNGVPKPKLDAVGKPVPYHISYPTTDDKGNFLTHPNPKSVIGIHSFGWAFIQATVAILILVGFESVTAMGGEAKNAKRDVPIAVVTSLLVQGAFCYLIEYFAANYFLNSGYTMQSAAASAAPSAT